MKKKVIFTIDRVNAILVAIGGHPICGYPSHVMVDELDRRVGINTRAKPCLHIKGYHSDCRCERQLGARLRMLENHVINSVTYQFWLGAEG
jgi:hypothetical protein